VIVMPLDRSFLDQPRWAMRTLRIVMRATPSSPRCKLCFAPFGGIGGPIVRLAGFSRSRKNPNFCNACFERAPHGGTEMEVGVMFADMRGFTARSERLSPAEAAAIANRFYSVAADVLIRHDAVIDKMEGDEVMALFIPRLVGGDYVREMLGAATDLIEAVAAGEDAWCPLGIGLAAGTAFVGNVGAGDVKDFTAIGDIVNTAARLQAGAAAGQIVVLAETLERAGRAGLPSTAVTLNLKGKADPVRAYVIEPTATQSRS
jgi:adenylate cyclase